MMLIVQTTTGSVDTDCRKGSSQSRNHGYMTGAKKSDAAIGHANAFESDSVDVLLSHMAARTPISTANPAAICGGITFSSTPKMRSLNQKLRTYVPSEPTGNRPLSRKGR